MYCQIRLDYQSSQRAGIEPTPEPLSLGGNQANQTDTFFHEALAVIRSHQALTAGRESKGALQPHSCSSAPYERCERSARLNSSPAR